MFIIVEYFIALLIILFAVLSLLRGTMVFLTKHIYALQIRKFLGYNSDIFLSTENRVLSHPNLLSNNFFGDVKLDCILHGKRWHWKQNGFRNHHNSIHYVPFGSPNGNLLKVSYPKALDWYLLLGFSFLFLSLIECMIVYVLTVKATEKESKVKFEVNAILNISEHSCPNAGV